MDNFSAGREGGKTALPRTNVPAPVIRVASCASWALGQWQPQEAHNGNAYQDDCNNQDAHEEVNT